MESGRLGLVGHQDPVNRCIYAFLVEACPQEVKRRLGAGAVVDVQKSNLHMNAEVSRALKP
jgi:hypothetical protein